MNSDQIVGRPLDSLTLQERWQLVNCWVALEIYTPEAAPLRIIEALGASAEACRADLVRRRREPSRYELQPLAPPYRP